MQYPYLVKKANGEIMVHILIVNGPNLKFLGQRQSEIYGYESLDMISDKIHELIPNMVNEMSIDFFSVKS